MTNETQRRLAAIVSLDVVGYSRLMGADETGTLASLRTHRNELIDPQVAEFGGRIVKSLGDGLLLEFPSVVKAVEYALQVQQAMAARNAAVAEDRRITLRIGINLGDIIIDGDDILGDGVNVAARLQEVSHAGGIAISRRVHEDVQDRLVEAFEDAGELALKNIARPVRVWRWTPAGGVHRTAADAAPPAASAGPARPSITVLPFNNMSGDPEQDYFADGITEDIITDLSKVSGLFVIARNSSFAYKDQSPDVRRVCRELGVRYALEGSVRRAGGRVRINAQLIDGVTGGHLWAERYDHHLEDIFAVQDEVTREIVAALKVALTSDEEARRVDRGKVDAEAYDCFMRARTCIYRFRPEPMAEARAMLERVIAIDPGFAPAYALLAVIEDTEYLNGWNGAGPDRPAKALELAEKAVAADENEPQAYHALALSQMWLRNLDEAERAALRAIELDPNFAGGFAALGSIRDFAGRHESAIEALEQALKLDPQYDLALQFIGRAQFSLRRYDEAEATFRRRLIRVPGSDLTRAYLASLYGHTGEHEQARATWRELLEISPAFSPQHLRQAMPYRDRAWFDHFIDGLRRAGIDA